MKLKCQQLPERPKTIPATDQVLSHAPISRLPQRKPVQTTNSPGSPYPNWIHSIKSPLNGFSDSEDSDAERYYAPGTREGFLRHERELLNSTSSVIRGAQFNTETAIETSMVNTAGLLVTDSPWNVRRTRSGRLSGAGIDRGGVEKASTGGPIAGQGQCLNKGTGKHIVKRRGLSERSAEASVTKRQKTKTSRRKSAS
ncbi:hypothetical protein C1H76_0070 [Elsinoe australis]|uniref:Uncharacterized protein n=1 Tax=Elsinoe australis TaxID=40998 RepID=A0A4U7BEU5_9PEZI|nr:hypothetical protein C1H76_0070 [Elsinoe australis]